MVSFDQNGYKSKRVNSSYGSMDRLDLDRVTEKWTMSIRNWGQVYGELSIMYEGRLSE